MTIDHAFRSSLAVLFLVLTGGGCSSSSQKNDGTVPDASSEARGSRPSLTASPSTLLNFGSVCPGTVSAPQTVQIMNIGDSAVPVDVKVQNPSSARNRHSDRRCWSTGTNGFLCYNKTFAPVAARMHEGDLR